MKTVIMFACLTAAWTATAAYGQNISDANEVREGINLSGEWEFQMDPCDKGVTEKWYEQKVSFDRKITVPGAWNAQGIGYESQQLLREYERTATGDRLLGTDRESDKLFHVYPGPGWYRRNVTIPKNWQKKVIWLKFGGVHRYADVWVNGKHVGTHIAYISPFKYDITKFVQAGKKARIVVRVDARWNKDIDPLIGCFDTLDFLFVTWGGIYRDVTLETTSGRWIEDVFVAPQVTQRSASVQVTTANLPGAEKSRKDLQIIVGVYDQDGIQVAAASKAVSQQTNTITLPVSIAQAKLWSPSQPYLYTVRTTLADGQEKLDAVTVRFGMREMKVQDGKFLLNGKPIFLRGYGDDCIYPNTIAPPADKEEYRRRFKVVKDYGFNYARHHSWFPPQEYFDVADEMGILLQPEFPIAYRWNLAVTVQGKQLYLDQWREIIKASRNHPSIVTWCMGNELYDSFDMAPAMYRLAKQIDPTRLVIDSDGVARQPRETLDFWTWQFNESTSFAYRDGKYHLGDTKPQRPVVAHEMGYFVTLPNLEQLPLFRQGIRPYWLYEARDLAHQKAVTGLYPKWVDKSNRLQALCIKTNIEAVRRSMLQGYSLWLFQDYPYCAEGTVDMFYRPKAITAADYRKFNSPTVLLIDSDQRNFRCDETVKMTLLVSRYEDQPSDNAAARWQLRAGREVLASHSGSRLRVDSGGPQELMPISFTMPRRPNAEKLTLEAELTDQNGTVANNWNLWLFPQQFLPAGRLCVTGDGWIRKLYPWADTAGQNLNPADCDLLVTNRLDGDMLSYLRAGGRILLLNPDKVFPSVSVRFRPSGWDPGAVESHLGSIINQQHPAMYNMPNEGWCDLQFHQLIQGGKTVLLDELAIKVKPIVRCIDMPQRFLDKAYLFEVAVGKGRLLVSGFNFTAAIEGDDPAGNYFLDQLVRYALSASFNPDQSLPPDYFKG